MRPLRLDIAGFAAFRDPITVDFRDTDYFALTGPTGSGKSTVIDAMTFALYGSAPRWGRDNAIQYALAPTANRCTVRLVFDVADQRYVVAREVRRSGKQISQKNPRLERYLDPAATGDPETDEPTESLAADTRTMKTAVAELLGLDFDDFCTCVVLPQGDFATFLKASVAERQTILLKLLGARQYEAISRLANRRAADANARIDALQGQLRGYDDATEEAETVARAREMQLGELATTLTGTVGQLSEVLAERVHRGREIETLAGQVALLTAVEAPVDIDHLQQMLAAADAAYADADRAERAARASLETAEEALRSGPERAPLEETLRWHGEWAQLSARLPVVTGADEEATTTLGTAQEAAAETSRVLDEARAEHEQCRSARAEAQAAVLELEQTLSLLTAVAVPDGTADLDRAALEADQAVDRAAKSVEQAETAVTETSNALAALPERSAIMALQKAVEDYTATASRLAELHRSAEAVTQELAAAEDHVALAQAARDDAEAEVDRVRTVSVAADLRPHLVVGDDCPVCAQSVATLPPPLAAPELASARAALDSAEVELRSATSAVVDLRTRLATLHPQTETCTARLAELGEALRDAFGEPSEDGSRDQDHDRQTTGKLLAQLDDAQAVQQSALRQRAEAQQGSRTADRQRTMITEQTRHGWASLHATRGQLATLGAPAITASGLADAWEGLTAWAATEADRVTSLDLAAAQAAQARADQAFDEAAARLAAASAAAGVANDQHTAAAVAGARVRTEHDDLVRRLAELEAALADRPAESEARDLLAEHHRLEVAATTARTAAQEAARTRQQAEGERDRRRAERETARARLHQVREPLVVLGAPALDETDLAAAWTALVGWATARTADLDAAVVEQQAALAAVDAGITRRLSDLDDLLVVYEVAPTRLSMDEVVTPTGTARLLRIPTDVEIAAERARAETAEIVRRRGESEKLQTKITIETETEQVARQLGTIMSARRFPQWLADAALDTLVADASASLLELSGRQFELTHERGEFFVIDHADADSLRSVKTLSGGETFQASLALALALSEQLSTLAAGGRTTLDSIFLDEGFGTLDPDALETVATTLENLAQGRRMVGIVTHVSALAERVPVRFEVSRDSRTSTIERAGS